MIDPARQTIEHQQQKIIRMFAVMVTARGYLDEHNAQAAIALLKSEIDSFKSRREVATNPGTFHVVEIGHA